MDFFGFREAAIHLTAQVAGEIQACDVDATGGAYGILIDSPKGGGDDSAQIHIFDSNIQNGREVIYASNSIELLIESNYILTTTKETTTIIHAVNSDRVTIRNNHLEPLFSNTNYIQLENTNHSTLDNSVGVHIGPDNFFLGAGNADGVRVGLTGNGEFPVWNALIDHNSFMTAGDRHYNINLINSQYAKIESNLVYNTYGAMTNSDITVNTSGGTNSTFLSWGPNVGINTFGAGVANLDVRGVNAQVQVGSQPNNMFGVGQGGFGYSNGTEKIVFVCQAGICKIGTLSSTGLSFLTGNAVGATIDNSFNLTVMGAGNISTTKGRLVSQGGENVVYRCSSAGMLPVGTLTTVSQNCGAAVDTGIKVP
jgi:hypothetical protein